MQVLINKIKMSPIELWLRYFEYEEGTPQVTQETFF